MKYATVGAVLVAALALAGCAQQRSTSDPEPPPQSNSTYELQERHIRLADGRDVTCLVYDSGKAGGISCDWVLANAPK